MKLLKSLSVSLLLSLSLNATGQDRVLFTVEDEPVMLDEFLYIYEKTNRDDADFSEASVQEYLDLYKKFKLKVYKAREMQLDTIQALQDELAGYRKQLANSYLSDREVLGDLTREAYDRMQQDVSFSHILFKVPAAASESLETQVYERALSVLERLRAGEDFATVATEVSEDESAKKNRGQVGYVTAMLPDGFYELENTLYTLPGGTYSRPVRSKLGYHIVKVNSKRAARGEIEVAQILIRSGRGKNSKARIDSLHQLIMDGANFEEVARQYSEDKQTASRGGYLGFFGINKYESIFENTAFRLREDGAISRPIKTSIGWHIIKRLSVKPKLAYEEVRRSLEAKVKEDGRFAIAEASLLDKVKDENGYEALDWDKSKFLAEIGGDFLTYKWKAPEHVTVQPIYRIGDRYGTTDDLVQYLSKNTATRLRLNRSQQALPALEELVDEFIVEGITQFEEDQLEEKFPEFKALMREYREGILLFEATKMKVWDKASSDTVGLKSFYRSHPDRYRWPARALVETITINSGDAGQVAKVSKRLSKWSGQKLLKKFNRKEEVVRIQSRLVDEDQLEEGLSLEKYATSTPMPAADQGSTVVKRVAQIIPPKRKTMDEARGYIIADYQDHLEKAWVDELMNDYEVVVNQDVLSSIVK